MFLFLPGLKKLLEALLMHKQITVGLSFQKQTSQPVTREKMECLSSVLSKQYTDKQLSILL